MLPSFDILDIIQLTRENTAIKTTNKSCCILSCRTEGESLFFYNNTQHTAKRGDLLYVPKGANYTQKCVKEELICFHLDTDSDLIGNIQILKIKDPEIVCELFKTALDVWRGKEHNYEYRCRSILYAIMAMFDIDFSGIDRPVYNRMSEAMKYLENNMFNTDFSIQSLCRSTYLSRSYFNKEFLKIHNRTPISYITEKRIERAKFLLSIGTYTNEEISTLCGFCDVKYFYTLFKKITGYTTSQYLKYHSRY